MQRYCQFCHRRIEDGPTNNKLGGPYFCCESHANKFFKGDDYVPPEPQPPQPPFFQKTEGPRLKPTFADYPYPTRYIGMLGH